MRITGTITVFFFFFFNDTATTEIYTLSLHDALPISGDAGPGRQAADRAHAWRLQGLHQEPGAADRSEEHTSELQSHSDLVCRLLLEKKKKQKRQLRIDLHTSLDEKNGDSSSRMNHCV